MLLTKGNGKMGQEIWGFGLPSARPTVCVSMTDLCRKVCYDRKLELFRPSVERARKRNLRVSRLQGFADLVIANVQAVGARTVRVHTGGEFYSAEYALKWLEVFRACRRVRFWFYTRTWRHDEIRPVLEKMARLRNVRVWYSLDRETGVPEEVPPRVRLAWLQADEDDLPPEGTSLVFRVKKLRKIVQTRVEGARVCPEEDGVQRRVKVTCGSCNVCYRPLNPDLSRQGLLGLPVLEES